MILSKGAGDALTAVVATGVQSGAIRLAEITHHPWRVLSVVLSQDESAASAESSAADHYGCRFSFQGGGFLVLFPGMSGGLIADAFTRSFPDRVQDVAKREFVSLGEVSNVLLNPLIGHLAKSWSRRLIISAPLTTIASPREHLDRVLSLYKGSDRPAATFSARLDSPQLASECRIVLFLDRGLLEGVAGPVAAK